MTQHTIRTDTAKQHLDKYRDRNPLHRWTLTRFFAVLRREVTAQELASVLDVGCGGAFLLDERARRDVHLLDVHLPSYTGVDVRPGAVEKARVKHPDKAFLCADLFDIDLHAVSADLVLAVQVLEHLPEPGPVLDRLTTVGARRVLITVSHEPWFQLCNFLRGRDLRRLGNHPEHLQHWSPRRLTGFVSLLLRVERGKTAIHRMPSFMRPHVRYPASL